MTRAKTLSVRLAVVLAAATIGAQAQPELLVPGAAPYDMDVTSNGTIYWTEVAVEACSPPYTLNSRSGSGGYLQVLVSGCTVQATEVRSDSFNVFFIDSATSTLARWDWPKTDLAPAPGSAFSGPGNMVISGAYVCWGDDGGIHRVPRYTGAGSPQTLVVAPFGYHNAHYWMAADSAYIYWADGNQGNRSLYRVPIAGGPFTLLISSLQDPQYLAVDDASLYWAEPGARIFRMPKAGGGWTSYNAANIDFTATGLMVDDVNVYWTQNGPALIDSVILRRVPKNSAAVADVLTGRGAAYLRQDNYYLYYRDLDGIKRLRKDSVAVTADFTLQGLEVTQGSQDLHNTVPLVADKATYVRAYPGGSMSGVSGLPTTAVLRGTRSGSPLPGSPLSPMRTPITVVNGQGIDRGTVSNSFLFALPATWLSNTVVLTAEINPNRTLPEISYANNTFTQTVTFTRKPGVGLYVVPILTQDHPSSVYTYRSPGFRPILQRFQSLYPTARVYIQQMSGVNGYYRIPQDGDGIIVSLMANYLLSAEFLNGEGGPDDKHHLVGLVSPDAQTGDQGGYANFCFPVSYVKMLWDPAAGGFSNPRGGFIMAQEVVHNYNGWPYFPTEYTRWQHVRCGVTNQINPDYPYPTGQIGIPGTNAAYGFDPLTLQAIAPDAAADFMSYCGPQWASDYTWRGLFDNLATLSASAAPVSAGRPAVKASTSAELLFVNGVMWGDGSVHWLQPAWRLDPALIDSKRLSAFLQNQAAYTFPGAIYSLDQLDLLGNLLASQEFEPFPPATHDDSPDRVFSLLVPFDPATAKLQVSQKGIPMAFLSVSSNAPTVSVTAPSGGTFSAPFVIQWAGKDADGDALSFTVQYSWNGGITWQMLAWNYSGTSLTQEVANLPGGPNCLVRVIASDGVNTGTGVSAPFGVQTHSPVAFIDAPVEGQLFPAGGQVVLNGDGYDTEDGALADSALNWYVDGQPVGSGRMVVLPGLHPGIHLVRLDALDSDKNLSSASVRTLVTASGEAPVLQIFPGSKDMLLSWHFSAEGYELESTDNLAFSKWSLVGGQPVLIGEQKTVSVSFSSGPRFYRLRNVGF